MGPHFIKRLIERCQVKNWPAEFSDGKIDFTHNHCYLVATFGHISVLAIPNGKTDKYFCVAIETTGLGSPAPRAPQPSRFFQDPHKNCEIELAPEWKNGESSEFKNPAGLFFKCSVGANEEHLSLKANEADFAKDTPYLRQGKWSDTKLDGEPARQVDFDDPKSRNRAGCWMIALSPRTHEIVVLGITAPAQKRSMLCPALANIASTFHWLRTDPLKTAP